ncbi:MAG TPA: response regulator transcription factor, partial [Caldithrix sp.]|nr:response regulator transcription factor [Caldithrix sp.]
FEELARAIRVVKSGKIYLSTNISDLLIKDYIRNIKDEETSYLAKLSEREREVLQLLAEGKNVKQIAAKLDISDKTVETHRQHIMRKLEIYNLADLIKFALREGITTLE